MFILFRTVLFLVFIVISSSLNASGFSNHYLILIDINGKLEIVGGLRKDRVDVPDYISPVTVYLFPDERLQKIDQHKLIKQQLLNEYINFLRSHDFIIRYNVSSKRLKSSTEAYVRLFHDKTSLDLFKTKIREGCEMRVVVFLGTGYRLNEFRYPDFLILPFPYYFIAVNDFKLQPGVSFPVVHVNEVVVDNNGDVVLKCRYQRENDCIVIHKVREGICDEVYIVTPEIKLILKSYDRIDSDDGWKQILANISPELQTVIIQEQSHTGLKKVSRNTDKHSPLINFLKKQLAQGSDLVDWVDENEGEFHITNMKEIYRLWRGEKYDKNKPYDFFAKSLHSLVKKELLMKTGGWGCYQYRFTK